VVRHASPPKDCVEPGCPPVLGFGAPRAADQLNTRRHQARFRAPAERLSPQSPYIVNESLTQDTSKFVYMGPRPNVTTPYIAIYSINLSLFFL
jgi:hypothetical protein